MLKKIEKEDDLKNLKVERPKKFQNTTTNKFNTLQHNSMVMAQPRETSYLFFIDRQIIDIYSDWLGNCRDYARVVTSAIVLILGCIKSSLGII